MMSFYYDETFVLYGCIFVQVYSPREIFMFILDLYRFLSYNNENYKGKSRPQWQLGETKKKRIGNLPMGPRKFCFCSCGQKRSLPVPKSSGSHPVAPTCYNQQGVHFLSYNKYMCKIIVFFNSLKMMPSHMRGPTC
jgi:hypothetical protein